MGFLYLVSFFIVELQVAVVIKLLLPKTIILKFNAEAILGSCSNLLIEIDNFI